MQAAEGGAAPVGDLVVMVVVAVRDVELVVALVKSVRVGLGGSLGDGWAGAGHAGGEHESGQGHDELAADAAHVSM